MCLLYQIDWVHKLFCCATTLLVLGLSEITFCILTGFDRRFGWPKYMLRVYQGNLPPSSVASLFNLSLPAGLEFYSDTCNFLLSAIHK